MYVIIYSDILSLTFGFDFSNSSPSYALVLLRANALEYWKELMGPKTVEEAFASDTERYYLQHGSLPFLM